jgi:DNA-damage-inducible protein D
MTNKVMKNSKNDQLVLFQSKTIRRIWHNDEWFFSVVDIIEALTESTNPRDYWFKIKIRVRDEDGFEPSTVCRQFKLQAQDGKMRETDCSNTEGIFRIIPSPKAEPFKRWLAKVGKERGITHENDYAILTAEISKATFGMTPNEYRKYKDIPKKSKTNLRDNMTDLELIFTMLGERVTTEISGNEKPKGMIANKKVARRGGNVAGNARKHTEKELGQSVISTKNYLQNGDKKSRLK